MGQLPATDHRGDERLPCWLVEARGRRGEQGGKEDVPCADSTGEGQAGKDDGYQEGGELRGLQQAAPVHAVGVGAPQGGDGNQGDRFGDADQAGDRYGSGDLVYLEEVRGDGRAAADLRQDDPEPVEVEVPMLDDRWELWHGLASLLAP